MDKFFKAPASDLASWVGIIVTVIVVIAVAKRLPFVKRFV